MDFKPDITCLNGRLATLPGGHDKEGRPLVVVNLPSEGLPLDVTPPLQYLLAIFSQKTKNRGLTIVIDARRCTWKLTRLCIRQVSSIFNDTELAQIIVLRPDAFWDKQRVENCTNLRKINQEVVFIPISRLGKYADPSQLPAELGGNFLYDHGKWMESRQKVEEFYGKAQAAIAELDKLHNYILNNSILNANDVAKVLGVAAEMADSTRMLVHTITETGRHLLQEIEYDNRIRKFASEFESMNTPQETLDTIEKVDLLINKIKTKQRNIEDSWRKLDTSFTSTKEAALLEHGMECVTKWIFEHAENRLNAQQNVGYDVVSAEELRRQHEALEMECWETYGAYAELMHKTNCYLKSNKLQTQNRNLISKKDFMDFACKSFALRLERRRNILIRSLRFFRLVSEYFDRTGEVFDSLVMGDKTVDFTTADKQLKELQEGQESLDAIKEELLKEGEKLSDMLSMPVKNTLGRDISIDYSEDIVNIRDILDATIARKNIFSDSVELQKLTLEQITHIKNYEKDAAQAIQWLDDLFQVLVKDHSYIGCSVQEIQVQKDEHQVFQETAKDTYNYGCQLLNASFTLRQSCKIPMLEHEKLTESLKTSWNRLLSVSQEQMTRLRVSAVFHRSVEDQCNQLRDLREAAATLSVIDLAKKKVRIKYYFSIREKLMVEVGRMVRLGRLLRTRLREPLVHADDNSISDSSSPQNVVLFPQQQETETTDENEVAIEAISERLTEVTGLAEELDQALRIAQQDCAVLTSTATTSTSEPIFAQSFTKKPEDMNLDLPKPKATKPEELRSDDEFYTASDCTLQHSRSSSYNTASECENRYSPWWEMDKSAGEDLQREKLVLAVGLPDLPPPGSVLRPSPRVPPGKIVREVTETTHLKVEHSHTLGVASYVLTSETVKQNKPETSEILTDDKDKGAKALSDVSRAEKKEDQDGFLQRMKEVGLEEKAWNDQHASATKRAIKSVL